MKQWFFAFSLSVACVCAPLHAAKSEGRPGRKCPSHLLGEDAETPDPELVQADTFAKLAAWVRKHRTVPKQAELALHLKMNQTELREFIKNNGENVAGLIALARQQTPQNFQPLQKLLAAAVKEHYKIHLKAPTREELAARLNVSETALGVVYELPADLKAFAESSYPEEFEKLRSRVAKSFTKLSKLNGRFATPAELAQELEVEEATLMASFGPTGLFESDEQLKELAEELSPNSFKHIMNTDVFNGERAERLLSAIKTKSRLIVTTAVAGTPVHKEFFASLLQYAKANDAEILVYPANMVTHGLDPILLETPGVHIVTETIELSPWLALNNIKLMAKQINPLMGLERLGHVQQSQIVGSPKVHVRTLPGKSLVSPKKLMSTGAITVAEYSGPNDKYIKQRTSQIAKGDHVVGALVLEKRRGLNDFVDVEGAGHFFARHIEYFAEAQGFSDLGYLYTPAGKQRTSIEAAVLGDIHVGMTDETLMASLRDQIIRLKPKRIILHDLMDGRSINHHERHHLLGLGSKAQLGMLDLGREIDQVTAFVNSLLALDPSLTIFVVPSNHDAWLHNWLEAGTFMYEPRNTKIGLKLAQYKSDGKDPFREALMEAIEYPKRVVFLHRGQDFRVAANNPVELGQHGDKGANGAKASINGMGVAFGRVVFGHTHTDARKNGSVNIGTFTTRSMPYSAEGTSNWSQSLALVDNFGGIQVLEYFKGGWFSRKEETETDAATFFAPGFPKAIPNDPDSASSLDQWD